MTPIAQMSLYDYVSLLRSCVGGCNLHWLSVSSLLKYLRSHIAWRPAGSGKDVKLFLVHYSGQTKICYQKVGVVFGSSKK
jgi:hypothetical protein